MFLPCFERQGTCHDITKSADSQINKFFRQQRHDCRILQKRLSKERLHKNLRKQESIRKSQIRWKWMLVPSLPPRNKIFSKSSQKFHRSKFQKFLVLSNCASFLYLVPNVLYRIVDGYFSWEGIINMGTSFKIGIISVVCKKGDYTQNHLKISHQKL